MLLQNICRIKWGIIIKQLFRKLIILLLDHLVKDSHIEFQIRLGETKILYNK